MMKRKTRSTTKKLVFAALAAALGVALLALGSLFEVLDISMAILASLFVVFGVIELGGAYPYLIFAVTAALSMLLVPQKSAPALYLVFFGYYPILKAVFEKYFSRVVSWLFKILLFYLALAVLVFAAVKILFLPFADLLRVYWFLAFLAGGVFVLYDIALTRLITFYLFRLRGRLHLD